MPFRISSAPSEGKAPDRPGVLTEVLFGSALLLLVLAGYAPSIAGGFLWDDAFHVTSAALRGVHGLARIWFEVGATQQYYPVLHSAFWLEHRMWGDAALGYRLVNVVLHAANAFLVYRVLERLNVPGSRLAAVLFAIHPVCVESVAWVSEQKNTLSLAFYLLSGLCYLGFAETGRRSKLAAATGWFVLALLSKSVTATLPAALIVLLCWKDGIPAFRRHLPSLGTGIVLGIAAGLFTAWVERTLVGASGGSFVLSWEQRILLAGRVGWFYLGKVVWPSALCFVYPRWSLDGSSISQWVGVVGTLGVVIGALFARRRFPGPCAAILLYLGALVPVMGFVNAYPFAYSYVADHFQYHAMVPVIGLCASAMALLQRRMEGIGRACLNGVVGGIVLILLLVTRTHSAQFASLESLYRGTLAVNPEAAMAHNNLGVLLSSEGRSKEAEVHFREAVRLRPDYAEAHNNLADLLGRSGSTQVEAIWHYQEALRLRPDYIAAHVNLANQLVSTPERWSEAEAHFRQALRINPSNGKTHNDFALALSSRPGRRDEALREYREAIALEPDYADAHAKYAFELSKTAQGLQEALSEYSRALELNPGDFVTHNNVANLLALVPERHDAAIAHYREALRLWPDYAEAHNNLANELAKDQATLPEAIRHYEAAVRIRPDYAEAHNNLAIAYANSGRISEAEAHFRRALEIRPDFTQARENLRALMGSK